jgi:hypothetical protein
VSAPLFTARIDHARATIRARGRLDHITADLLRGTVETLQRDGHRDITLDLAQLTEPDRDGVLGGRPVVTFGGWRATRRRRPARCR